MTTTARRQIIAGPSREELFDALRLYHEGRTVTFTLAPRAQSPASSGLKRRGTSFTVQVCMLSIDAKSGGDNWTFTIFNPNRVLGSAFHDGQFNTSRREGWMT